MREELLLLLVQLSRRQEVLALMQQQLRCKLFQACLTVWCRPPADVSVASRWPKGLRKPLGLLLIPPLPWKASSRRQQ